METATQKFRLDAFDNPENELFKNSKNVKKNIY